MYKNWLAERGVDFPAGVRIATLDAFHIVKLAGDALDEVRRCVQQDTTGHRGRKGDPLCQIRLLLRASRHKLTPRQQERLRAAFTADEAHISVEVVYHCAQHVRDVFHQATPVKADAWPLISSNAYQRVPSPKSPDWVEPYASGRTHSTPTSTQAEPATHRTEAINGIIELGIRIARGYRNPTNYQL
ncbi:transposase [Schaalia odontolytica]|uniref:transposase n=1 Tax=Schaalia odontolytica TaxID=1660 RepID=UPI0028D8A212|nr:transposase [Schaalia odontolytica]